MAIKSMPEHEKEEMKYMKYIIGLLVVVLIVGLLNFMMNVKVKPGEEIKGDVLYGASPVTVGESCGMGTFCSSGECCGSDKKCRTAGTGEGVCVGKCDSPLADLEGCKLASDTYTGLCSYDCTK